ncbi:MAG: hypothetical protein Q4C67_06575, partial [Deinococcus sp.]|nr:hypothetical protein [Deinococcus sp.]
MTMTPSYPLLPARVVGPATTPPRVVSSQATGVKVTLSGPDFVVQVQVSNASAPDSTPEHLF